MHIKFNGLKNRWEVFVLAELPPIKHFKKEEEANKWLRSHFYIINQLLKIDTWLPHRMFLFQEKED